MNLAEVRHWAKVAEINEYVRLSKEDNILRHRTKETLSNQCPLVRRQILISGLATAI